MLSDNPFPLKIVLYLEVNFKFCCFVFVDQRNAVIRRNFVPYAALMMTSDTAGVVSLILF